MQKLQLYTIMPLDTKHIDEICEDIKNQYEQGVADCPLFKMTLVPEGNPPIDKAKIMSEQYALFRKKLSDMNIPSGVLVQATIGHNWKLSEPFPFRSFTKMNNGEPQSVVCPYDAGFRKYIYNAMRTIAEQNPDHIMVDDDFRLIGRDSDGCGCPLHMKKFNELAKTQLTREELHKILINESNKEYIDIYIETQKQSLVETAKIMRAGIDSVNPAICGSFCCVGNNAEFASEIAAELAGKNNPVVVRINNGNYTAGGARWLSDSFQRAAAQTAKLKNKADIILAETDTCPQNRYSTGAMQLHSHFTGTILEGAAGAKHWITRLNAYEPQSGKAYRKILAKYSGFYQTLAEIVPTLKRVGCRIPISNTPIYKFGKNWDGAIDGHNAWSSCVLERLGIPLYFSAENTGVLCLEGDVFLSDKQLTDAFKNPMLVSSDAAQQLINRGFGKYIGVEITDTEEAPSLEISSDGNKMSLQHKTKKLVLVSENTKELSGVYHTTDNVNYKKLFPGITEYKNELGGTVFVFCGTPKTGYNISEAFSFLNYSRKQQLVSMLRKTGCLPVYYPGDEEVYVNVAETADNGLFVGIFNIGLDPIEQLELVCFETVNKIYRLTPSGNKESIGFEHSDNRYILECCANTLEPVILFLDK